MRYDVYYMQSCDLLKGYTSAWCVLDETHPVSNRESVASRGEVSTSGDQSFRSADMTQDEVVDYVQ